MYKRIPLFLLAALLLCGYSIADTVIEEIVARVNSEIITRSEFQRSRDQLMNELKERFPQEAEQQFAQREKDVLRDMIDQDLLVQRGKDLGINADTELIKKLDDLRKQMNLENMEDLEKAAQSQGISYEDFKQNMRNQIITQQVIGREVSAKVQITKEEEEQFYKEHQKELDQPEGVHLSEILVAIKKQPEQNPESAQKTETPPTPEEIAAAQQRAGQLLEELKKGAKFDEVAKKSSDGPTAGQGGDLGFFNRGTLAKELEEKTFGMKPGEISDVIRTKQGFIILKVNEHRSGGIPALKEVEPQVQEAIYSQKMQPALRAYLTKLREDAYIDIKQGYADTGASPNQTKPIMTAAATGEPEKKKKKKKMLIF